MQVEPGEKTNLCDKYPERVKVMVTQLKEYVENGRSTPGIKQPNDVPVDIWKLDTMPEVDISILDDYE